MFRLESVSPLVVAWAVSLGLGGVLLALFFSGDPAPQHVAVPTPAPVDRTREAPADQAGSEPVRPGQDFAPVEQPVVKVVRPAAAAAKKVIPDNKPIGVVEPLPQPGPTEPPGPRVATKPKQPLPPTAPKATPAPRPASKIEAALKLPIMRYVHQKPVTVLVVIREIEQLGGVDVRLDEGLAGDSRLERTIQLDLDKTTVGGILDVALEMVGLTCHVHDGYVLIVLPVNGADSRGTR